MISFSRFFLDFTHSYASKVLHIAWDRLSTRTLVFFPREISWKKSDTSFDPVRNIRSSERMKTGKL